MTEKGTKVYNSLMDQALKERFARLGPVQGFARVRFGSRAVLALHLGDDIAKVRTIDATLALARRGMAMLDAKRAIEAVAEHGEAVAEVPMVESMPALIADLREAGIRASPPRLKRPTQRHPLATWLLRRSSP